MSTGASNDFERATKLARNMVTKYGMSDALGTMVYADDKDSGFWRCRTRPSPKPPQQKVDAEIRRILDEQYACAQRHPARTSATWCEAMADALLEWETIDAEQVEAIMEGRRPGPPSDWAKSGRISKDDPGTGPAAGPIGGPMPQT